MKRPVLVLMVMLSGAAASGQSLLDCVDPDVRHALLLSGSGEQQPVITAAVPTEIAALKMPGGFTWIGSAVRVTGRADATTNVSQVTAAWRSTLAPDAARTAAVGALRASGWDVQPPPGAGSSVFISTSMPVPQPACREGKPVTMNVSAVDGVTYVMFSIQRGNSAATICNSLFRQASTTANSLQNHMPRLQLPVDPSTGDVARMYGASSGGGTSAANASAQFSTKDSVGNVAQFFAKQMAEQGWTRDASGSGASTAASSWLKRDDSGSSIQAMLLVNARDERQFSSTLRIIRLQ